MAVRQRIGVSSTGPQLPQSPDMSRTRGNHPRLIAEVIGRPSIVKTCDTAGSRGVHCWRRRPSRPRIPSLMRPPERLRITPSPLHSDSDIDHLVRALSVVWTELDLTRAHSPAADLGRTAPRLGSSESSFTAAFHKSDGPMDRHRELKQGTAWHVRGCPQSAPVMLDDRSADR